jgi:hypothetical protein
VNRLVVYLAVCLLVCSASVAWAQNAQIAGRVADQLGAVVPGAKVVVMNEGTGASRSVDTDSVGLYVVPSLMPGNYSVSVQLTGFRPLVRNGVTLEVGQNARLDFVLEAAITQEALTVSADASHINVSDGSVGNVIDRRFVENVPMNGRSFQSLILLTPGATTNSPQSSAGAPGTFGDTTINGQRAESNRYTVDGVSANNGTGLQGLSTNATGGGLPSGTALGTTQSLVSLDALQEFRVSTSSYSAEYGRSPGGQFSFVTRSGTNTWHGSLFEYLRNDTLDANDWFNSRFGVAKPSEQQSDFGGTLGGPLRLPGLYNGRDRTFFFFSYEGLRLRQPLAASLVYVPSLSMRQGAPPPLRDALNGYPLPTGADQPNGLAEYVMTDSLPSRLDSTSIRIDHNIGSATRLFFRYSDSPSDTTLRNVAYTEKRRLEPQSFTVGATSPISHRFNNEIRFGYSPNRGSATRSYLTRDGVQAPDLFKLQGIDLSETPSSYVTVALNFPGSLTTVGISDIGQDQTQWNLVDTVDVIAGRHQFRAGIDMLQTRSVLQRNDPTVSILYNTLANVLANNSYSSSVIRYRQVKPVYDNFGAFVQDEWRLASRLALSLGVRWELSPAPGSATGQLPRVITGTPSDVSTLALGPEGTKLWPTAYNNFAPRVGAAYVVRESPQYETVLRTGVGVFYDSNQNIRPAAFENNPGQSITRSYGTSFGSTASFPLTASQLNISLADSLLPPYQSAYQFGDAAHPLVLPYTYQGNLSVEQALGARQSVTLSYVGARGRRLIERDLWNYGALSSSFPLFNAIRNGTTSSYDAMQAQLQRRLSHGLQAFVAYTWSHAIDYGSANGADAARKGDADFDVRHNFSAAVSYEFPTFFTSALPHALLDHWSLDGRFLARSAFPVTLNGNYFTDPASGQQNYGGLNLVPGVPVYLDRADLPGGRQINPAAFQLPPAGLLVGTAPRNFVRGFGATQLDAVLRRDFPFSGTTKLQFRLEAFNVLNHPNLGFINNTFGNPQFGQATKMLNSSLGGLSALYQQGGPRSLQISLRFAF